MDQCKVAVSFNRVNHFIAVAAFGSMLGDGCQIRVPEISITYSDYVKSQILDNVVTRLFGRSIEQYYQAGRFLAGDLCYAESAEKVLTYFYEDMFAFLCKNAYNVRMELIVDAVFDLPITSYCVSQVRDEAISLLQSQGEVLMQKLAVSLFAPVIDDALGREDVEQKLDSYSLAAVLKSQLQGEQLTVVKLEE